MKIMFSFCRCQELYSQLPDIRESISFVKNYLSDFSVSTAFSHNDFMKNNIIYDEESGQYIHITMTSEWARWRLKSPASRLFTQPFIRV